jgi:peptidoglycan/xylan/chitin deacetylase (PgdA/CDA1 family)
VSGLVINLLAIVIFIVGLAIIIFSTRRLRKGSLSLKVALPLAVLLIVGLSVAFAMLTSSPLPDPSKDPNMPGREQRLLIGGYNLLPGSITVNPYLPSGSSFTISDTKQYISPPTFARPSEAFHFTYTVTGTGSITSACTWEDEGHIEQGLKPGDGGGIREDVIGSQNLSASGQLVYGSCTAPNNPAVANLRVVLKQAGGNASVSSLRIATDSLRVEQWPEGRDAALAFSFDWESAMGGPIHSRGMTQHDVQFAVTQGIEMRTGTENLIKIFADTNIHATFYATGYNLLDGSSKTNPLDQIYKWASPKNGWASDFWLTHGWYSDDPFSNTTNAPAWYFGDQADRLRAAGHEIATHTFGHLYVRGATPDQLDADLTRWQQAAAAKGITDVTSFAFPWRSSNSVDQPFYDVMRKHGIVAVTRLYEQDLHFPFSFSAAPKSGGMLVVPDFLLGSGSTEETANTSPGEGQGLTVKGLNQAKQVVDADIAQRGVTSFWNHPLAVADPSAQLLWTEVAAYAAQQRDAGRLWIAPVGEIVARHNAVRQIRTTTLLREQQASQLNLVVDVYNPTDKPIAGVTVSADGEITSALLGGKQVTLNPALAQRGRLVIGTLAPLATIRVAMTVKQ